MPLHTTSPRILKQAHMLNTLHKIPDPGKAKPEGFDAGLSIALATQEAAEHGDYHYGFYEKQIPLPPPPPQQTKQPPHPPTPQKPPRRTHSIGSYRSRPDAPRALASNSSAAVGQLVCGVESGHRRSAGPRRETPASSSSTSSQMC